MRVVAANVDLDFAHTELLTLVNLVYHFELTRLLEELRFGFDSCVDVTLCTVDILQSTNVEAHLRLIEEITGS